MTDQPHDQQEDKKLVPFFPDYILDEIIAWYIALAVLVILASLLPSGLEEEANPLSTPAHIKPEWYFLFLYQSLKLVPRVVGVLAPGVGVLILLALPFIDRSSDNSRSARLIRGAVGAIVMTIVVALTIWGILS